LEYDSFVDSLSFISTKEKLNTFSGDSFSLSSLNEDSEKEKENSSYSASTAAENFNQMRNSYRSKTKEDDSKSFEMEDSEMEQEKNNGKNKNENNNINKDDNENEFDIEISDSMNSNQEKKPFGKFGKLPANFDWRNVDGTNYDSPIRKQGECGSCYAISAVSVMEARIRIASNNRLKPLLSPSSVLACSRYNQGCFGGYPYLVGKFGKEFGFVEENCQPYTETDDKCFDFCFHEKRYKIKNFG